MLLSQKSFNVLFAEKHHVVRPALEVELIGEKVSVERVWGLEKCSPREKNSGQNPGNHIPALLLMDDVILLDEELCEYGGLGLATLSTRAHGEDIAWKPKIKVPDE